MTLTTEEIARVEAEAAAITEDPDQIAVAVADMEARSDAEPVGIAFDSWRNGGLRIAGIERSGRVLLDAGKPLVGNRLERS